LILAIVADEAIGVTGTANELKKLIVAKVYD
jgi:hypothetical protein